MVLRMSEPDGTTLRVARATNAAHHPSWARSLVAVVFERYATLLLLVILIIGFSVATDRFLTTQNLTNLLVVQAVISCVAFAAIVPLIAGEFDLSLGNMIGFLAMVGAVLGEAGYGAVVVVSTMI